MEPERQEILRLIPPVNQILENSEIIQLINKFGRQLVLDNIRQAIKNFKNRAASSFENFKGWTREDIKQYMIQDIVKSMKLQQKGNLRKVINATGVILHTNLGRAPLPYEALEAVCEVSKGYSNLEYDLDCGMRGSRHSHVEGLLTQITGAESAMVVNNNAAAVFLSLNTLAYGKEVVVSRGQQVEIGGSFRIPDIISRSGARMVEVGTTNKTRLSDYKAAVSESTAILLKVHTSNFKVVGFVEEVSLKEMSELGKKYNLLVMEDLGSGSLVDLSQFGLPYEPTVQYSINMGADLVTFSGDKLLGGPQAGIIAGRKCLIDRIKKNPLARMVRVDKMTLAALEAVLRLYLNPEKLTETIPVLKMLAKDIALLEKQAKDLKNAITQKIKGKYNLEVIPTFDETGGGTLPGVRLEGRAVAIRLQHMEASQIQHMLQKTDPPLICRINKDSVLLDVRTIDEGEYSDIVRIIEQALQKD